MRYSGVMPILFAIEPPRGRRRAAYLRRETAGCVTCGAVGDPEAPSSRRVADSLRRRA
jgi:hypothetical protein